MLDQTGKTRHGSGLTLVASLLLLTCAPAVAQTTAPFPGPAVSTREGNIYDHRDHQPTAADDAAAGVAPPGVSEDEVQKEVQDLLQQTDRLDEQSEQYDRELPARSPGER